jgi:hypothetical protein
MTPMRCVLCGRVTLTALVFIASHPVGPKCARRAGLVALAARNMGAVRPGVASKTAAVRCTQMELSL